MLHAVQKRHFSFNSLSVVANSENFVEGKVLQQRSNSLTSFRRTGSVPAKVVTI
jgi:hypothetical protein